MTTKTADIAPVYDEDEQTITGQVMAHMEAAKAAVIAAKSVMDEGRMTKCMRLSVVENALFDLVSEAVEALRSMEPWDDGCGSSEDLADAIRQALNLFR